MQINEKYRLGKYPLGYQLEEKKIKKTGEEHYVPIAYYNFDLAVACRSIFKRLVHDSDTSTLEAVLAALKQSESVIERLVERGNK